MKVITYRITLLEPALVTSQRGDPNSGVAFDYVPGSVLRGIFIGKYLRSTQADAADPTLRRLFFDGTTRYLNGYPLDAHDQPTMPVPVSWQAVKDQEGEIFDFAVETPDPDEEQQWQPVSKPFYTFSYEKVRLVQPARNIAVHTQRTARFGRAMPEYRPDRANEAADKLLKPDEIPGAVYRYDALAAGQTFEASIICDNDSDEQVLKGLVEGHVIIGGSRSGGYGRAEVLLSGNAATRWDTTGDDPLEDRLIVTLQSDVLLRDARGQFAVDPELLRQVLSKHLQVKLELEDAFLDTELVGGFNRKWGLPLPQSLAVRMGSVLIFKDPAGKDPNYNRKLMDALEIRGIGERRAEGFGRIAFNRQRAATLPVTANTRQHDARPVSTMNDAEANRLAHRMLERMLRQHLDEGLLSAAGDTKIVYPPSNTQLSRLREIVLKELRAPQPGTGKICQFIKSIEARGNTRRQFERSTVNKKLLLSWLKELLRYNSQDAWTMDDNEWKDLLRVNRSAVSVTIGGLQAEINDKVRLEYVLRLIDLVLANAARLSGKEN